MTKEYRLSIDPRILELLGPNLYTNIYYVLAELIANAYDADAANVYVVVSDDAIRVEDDGRGMSYSAGEIDKFLNVAAVSRTSESEAVTGLGRRKMGRKGVGKLAAISVSEEVEVLTLSGGEVSGFVLSRHPAGEMLEPIPDDQVVFRYATESGTAIVMRKPEYTIHKTLAAVKRNLLKMFPQVGPEFKIHVVRGNEYLVLDDFDRSTMSQLSTLITLGEEYAGLCELVPNPHPERRDELVSARDSYRTALNLVRTDGIENTYELEVKGWIGTYRSTRELKAERSDFPDNFISLFANGKLGEFNILPAVGQNRLSEVYVVGQLHVDLFELTELPDIALSNRQGYKSDDLRYSAVLDFVRDELLSQIRKRRDVFADLENQARKQRKANEQLENESRLKASVDEFRRKVAESAAGELDGLGTEHETGQVEDAINRALNEHIPDLGLKALVDSQKKKVLISHTGSDKPFADVIYQMLLHNGLEAEDILYTNSENGDSRIPHGQHVWDYLRDFFVDSYSTEKVMVLFVTSEVASKAWGAVLEVGAAWITKKGHEIFNIAPHKPEHPLDVGMQWQTTGRDETTSELSMNTRNADILCEKIEATCTSLGIAPQSRASNVAHLGTLVVVAD